MRVTVVFDEENYISPAEAGIDDLLKMLAEVMTEEGVSGTFFLIGERVRCLRDRGRRDVVDAIARHDLGFHTNMGSIHPTATERVEHADWTDGCARMAAEELGGAEEIEEIVGKPLRSFARHGGSFSPQMLAMLGRRGMAYVYSPSSLPRHNITWYCNTLNFSYTFAVFQQAYHSRETFLAAEAKFEELLKENREREWVAIFHSHPCRLKMQQFSDMNYFRGLNPTPAEWRMPAVDPNYTFDEVRRNWAFHCQRLKSDPRLQLRTIRQLCDEFGVQSAAASREEVMALAARAAECDAPFCTERFTAAETLDLLARAYRVWRREGAVPASLPRRDVFGPTRMPLCVPTALALHPEALLRVARGIDAAIRHTGALPSAILCAEGTPGSTGEIGPGTALNALGLALTGGNPDAVIPARPTAPYPIEGDAIADEVRKYRRWPVHRLDLDMSRIALLAACQSWTLKPALAL